MTGRANQVAAEQFAALLVEAEPALWGRAPGDGFILDPAGTARVFRAHCLTAAELRTVAVAAQALANAAWDAALADLADTVTTLRRNRG